MRLALVHDQLLSLGGSERVFQYMCEAFPDAPAYTLTYDPAETLPYFRSRGIRTSWLDPFTRSVTAFRNAFPIATHVMEAMDFSQYDVVLSSSATIAKYVRVPNGLHICYCYTPTRAIWQAESYFGGGVKARIFRALLPHLKRRDVAAANRVDQFIGISTMSAQQIRDAYGRDAKILPCPIELDRFSPVPERGDHYLIVSRLERWKKLDYAIEACTQLGVPLRVVGGGEDEARLRAMAGPTVEFLGALDDAGVAAEYARARAVLFTPHLEYGLVPLEAVASGTPVIAYGEGGIRETMIGFGEASEMQGPATALFFYEQTAASIGAAITAFRPEDFAADALVKHAEAWGVPAFRERLRQMVDAEWKERGARGRTKR